MQQLDEERMRLEAEREMLEQSKAENDAFVRNQLENALHGKGMLEIMQAEKEHLANQLRNKEQAEADRIAKIQMYKDNRARNEAQRKQILSRGNIETYIQKYFVEVAVCFLMDRDKYKDENGLAPYNKVIVTQKATKGKEGKVQHLMAVTEDRLFRFSELLVDTERLMDHDKLYTSFVELKNEQGMSLCRISEKLHLLYLQFYRKDFVKDYRYKEDFENLLILCNNNYEIERKDFRSTFSNKPFMAPGTDDEIVEYLQRPEIQEQFVVTFPNWSEFGFENIFTAMYVCLVSTMKLETETLTNIILKDANRITKLLDRGAKKTSKSASKGSARKKKANAEEISYEAPKGEEPAEPQEYVEVEQPESEEPEEPQEQQ